MIKLFFNIVFLNFTLFASAQIEKQISIPDDKIKLEILEWCPDTNFIDEGLHISLKITNLTTDTLWPPEKYFPGPMRENSCNLGWEIMFCPNDSCFPNDNWTWDSHVTRWPPNTFKLYPLTNTIVAVKVDDIYFEEKGKYKIRMILKKKSAFREIVSIDRDIYSDWKTIELPFAIWRKRGPFKH